MNGTSGIDPGAMIASIGALVDEGIQTVTGKVQDVREWSNRDPCARQAFLDEHATNTVAPNLQAASVRLATLEVAGNAAVDAAILANGRDSALDPVMYTGGRRLSNWLEDGPIPTPPGTVLAAIFGGPIGAGVADEAWLAWIEDRLPVGQPSGGPGGTPVLGRGDFRVKNGVFRGPAMLASWRAWVEHERLTVQPFGVLNWRAKIAGLKVKVSLLRAKLAQLEAEIDHYQRECGEWQGRRLTSAELALAAQIESERRAQGTDRIRVLVPLGIAAIVALFFGGAR